MINRRFQLPARRVTRPVSVPLKPNITSRKIGEKEALCYLTSQSISACLMRERRGFWSTRMQSMPVWLLQLTDGARMCLNRTFE
jgi:hypothetical protein